MDTRTVTAIIGAPTESSKDTQGDNTNTATLRAIPSMETKSEPPTQQCHLLRLPPEVRNLIYKHLFSDISPCSELVYYTEADARPPGERLPAFKRRIAAGFACVRSREGRHCKYTLKEYNQLKYVCRQLQAECTDLELRHAPVLFRRVKDELPGKRFVDFVNGPSGINTSLLRRVELDPVFVSFEKGGYQFDNVKTFIEIATFCRCNPLARVQYNVMDCSRIKSKRGQIWLFAHHFVFLKLALRGSTLDIFKRGGAYHDERLYFLRDRWRAEEWRRGHDVAELNAPNLSFRSKNTKWPSEQVILQSEVHFLAPCIWDFIKNGL
ncbi:uncharacterized protein EI97DRAFT_437178 [Westerdykella ornata]|uniref:Uncharacterized protein n=1 Tax=Westerdykella ornata TaxID=318751 RepID=A0A6A6J858_WESOR|nr:uncharacterized protein EI97DRAFT_437178 [Westerdykella ornata]KAF2272188.1 hypothetical protein EI97DRAFT_437178 [Westerdykella ornata]